MSVSAKPAQASCVLRRLLKELDKPKPEWNGSYVRLWMPGGSSLDSGPTFARGYYRAVTLCFQLLEKDQLFLPTDEELTDLINEQLPEDIPSDFEDEWRCGFLLAWVLMWHWEGFYDCSSQIPTPKRGKLHVVR
jgi:hypothetical protein